MTAELTSRYFHSGEECQLVLLDYQKEREENIDNCRSVANSLTLWFLKRITCEAVQQ